MSNNQTPQNTEISAKMQVFCDGIPARIISSNDDILRMMRLSPRDERGYFVNPLMIKIQTISSKIGVINKTVESSVLSFVTTLDEVGSKVFKDYVTAGVFRWSANHTEKTDDERKALLSKYAQGCLELYVGKSVEKVIIPTKKPLSNPRDAKRFEYLAGGHGGSGYKMPVEGSWQEIHENMNRELYR